MGQFEYSVELSRVRPEDIPKLAEEYLKKKQEEDNKERQADDIGNESLI
jgi:DNA-binding NtrC family response regulator